MQWENEKVEYKVQMPENIYKSVIAFANTSGGTIYVGIDDQGNFTGIDNVDETYTKITNGIRDAIAPDVTIFVRYTLQDDEIICIEVREGSYKPYYLKNKGLKPSGVFVRQGASSVPASQEQIRQMIKDSDGDVFEEKRSLYQELSFEEAKKVFQKYNVAFSKDKYVALGIKNLHDNLYTNLAEIVSDECKHTTKVAVFGDTENFSFKDAKEFTGSVFKQLEDTFSYLMLCNRTGAVFKGLERIEMPDYPEAAVREALINALVHRDYSFSGSIIINVNDAFMEFISLGGLPSGLSEEDIRNGVSQPRNKRLAEVFHRLKLIESYGTGIRKIYYLYKNCSVQPEIKITPNAFKLVLPNINVAGAKDANTSSEKAKTFSGVSAKQVQILQEYLAENGEIDGDKLQELLQIKKARAYQIAKNLREGGLIEVVGRGKEKKYRLLSRG